MGDNLAAIREKSQAHQEESKAKRFRDRGGLWQPLSPSKNMLLGILNSAEFRNIAEADTTTRQKDRDAKPAEGSQNGIVRSKGPKLSTNEKAGHVGTKDVFTEGAKHQIKPILVKSNGSHKAGTKLNSRAKVESDRDCDQGSGDEIPSVSRDKVQSSTRIKKNDVVNKSQQQTPPAISNGGVAGGPRSQDPPQRPKRSTKRKLRTEDSDQEDIESDYRPSPAKKPRARGPAKAAAVKPRSTKQAKGPKPTTHRSKVKEKTVQLDAEDLVERRAEVSLNHQGSGTSSNLDAPNDAASSTKCGRKRALPTEVSSANEEQPSPLKRRRTKTVPEPTPNSKVMKKKPKPNTDDSPFDLQEDNTENLKPRTRRGSKPPKSPAKPKSQPKGKGKSRRVSSDEDGEPETSVNDAVPDPKTKLRDPRLSTIMEAEESDDEHRSQDDGSRTKARKCPRAPSITRGGSVVPLRKQHRTQTVGSVKEASDQTEGVGPVIASTNKSKVVARAKCKGTEATEVRLDTVKDNARAGMTRRRRKKVEYEAVDMEPDDSRRAIDMAIAAQYTTESQEGVLIDKVTQKRSARAASKQKSQSDAKPQHPSSSEQSQSKTVSVEDSAVKILSKRTTTKRTPSTESKPKPEAGPNRRPEMDLVKDEAVPKISSKKRKGTVEEEQKKPEQRKAVIRGKPPPLRDVEFEPVMESDIDELDLLS